MVGFGDNLGAILGFLAFGVVAEAAGMTVATWATAAAVVVMAVVFVLLARAWARREAEAPDARLVTLDLARPGEPPLSAGPAPGAYPLAEDVAVVRDDS